MAGLTKQDDTMLQWDNNKTTMQHRLGDFVQYFQVGVPVNSSGIPKVYIDPTQLLPHLINIDTPDALSDEIVDNAKIAINFDDGMPTIDGIPFWERLEGEPIPYYKMFKEYRELKYVDIANKGVSLTRSIAKLAENSGMSGKQLNALAKVFHWQSRVKAYDYFKEYERQLTRQRDVELLECKHAKISNQLLDQAVEYLLGHPEQLSPKVAIDLATLAMKSGRISVGLNPDKPGSTSESSGGRGGTNINIVSQNSMVGDGGVLVQDGDDLSAVERKTKENGQDVTHIQSILHVLNASGAFSTAQQAAEEDTGATIDVEATDVDYEVLPN